MVNLLVAFILELCMLGAWGYWGFQTGQSDLLKLILGIGTPLVVILIWARLMAPRSKTRLTGLSYLGLKTVLFGGAALALASTGQVSLALIFGVVSIINQILLIVWKDETLM